MIRRLVARALAVVGLAGLLTLLARPLALASDVFQNIAPASPLGSAAAFNRFPLSHYEIDQHFTAISASITGGLNVDGLLPMIAYFFGSEIWHGTAFVAKLVIELFAFAFSLDLVNGSSATGGAGALAPVSQAIHSIYGNVFGAPWLVLAFSGVAIWAMWKALVQRRFSETAGALALSLIYIVAALFFVVEPGQTIGQASRWTNEMSQAFLSISDHGDPTGGEAATADDADQLWGLLVERPWAVLEFGGLEHCALAGTGDEDHDPVSVAVRPLSKDGAQDAALARQLASGTEVSAEGKTCINNANKYSTHFLRFGSGTEERNAEYDALDHGDAEKLPEADDERAGYHLGVADKPATDAFEEGGQSQRLFLSVLIAVGELGAFLLLGSLSIGVILSQVLLLLLLAFSPVALVAAAIPGRGHDFFKAWLEKLGGYLLRKAAYSLVLAVLLAVNAAIANATSQLGWLLSFGLQAAFFWAVLIQRRTLASGIIGIATGPRVPGGDLALDAVALYAGARLGLAPIRAAGRAAKGIGGLSYRRYRSNRAERQSRRLAPFLGTRYSKDLDHGQPPAGGAAGANSRSPERSDQREAAAVASASPEGVAKAGGREGRAQAASGEATANGQKAGPKVAPKRSEASQEPAEPDAKSPGRGGERNRQSAERDPRPSKRTGGEPKRDQGRDSGRGSRRQAADTASESQREDAPRGPERRSKPNARQRPPDRGDGGGGGAPAASSSTDSRLSEELRSERERSERPAPPDGGAGQRSTDADPGPAETSDSDSGTPAEESSSPPRRRRRRRFLRRRK